MPGKSTTRIIEVIPEGLKGQVQVLERRLQGLGVAYANAVALKELEGRLAGARQEMADLQEQMKRFRADVVARCDALKAEAEETKRTAEAWVAREREALRFAASDGQQQILIARESLAEDRANSDRLRTEILEQQRNVDERTAAVAQLEESQRLEAISLRDARAVAKMDSAAVTEHHERLVVYGKELEAQQGRIEKARAAVEEEKTALEFQARLVKTRVREATAALQEANKRKQAVGQTLAEAQRLESEMRAGVGSVNEARSAIVAENERLNQWRLRLERANEEVGDKESRLLQLDARVREEQARLEAAKDEVRRAWVKVQKAQPAAP